MNHTLAAQLVLAPALSRVVAFLIDTLIVGAFEYGLTGLGLLQFHQGRAANTETFAALLLILSAYNIGFVALYSATPGKMLLRIQIVDRNGKRLRPDTAILRVLILLPEYLIPVGLVASLVLLFIDPLHRTIHDRVAGTLVVRRPAAAPSLPN